MCALSYVFDSPKSMILISESGNVVAKTMFWWTKFAREKVSKMQRVDDAVNNVRQAYLVFEIPVTYFSVVHICHCRKNGRNNSGGIELRIRITGIQITA